MCPWMQPCYKWWEVPYYWAGLKARPLLVRRSLLALVATLYCLHKARCLPSKPAWPSAYPLEVIYGKSYERCSALGVAWRDPMGFIYP